MVVLYKDRFVGEIMVQNVVRDFVSQHYSEIRKVWIVFCRFTELDWCFVIIFFYMCIVKMCVIFKDTFIISMNY